MVIVGVPSERLTFNNLCYSVRQTARSSRSFRVSLQFTLNVPEIDSHSIDVFGSVAVTMKFVNNLLSHIEHVMSEIVPKFSVLTFELYVNCVFSYSYGRNFKILNQNSSSTTIHLT